MTDDNKAQDEPYTMRIEKTIVDKLGLKLYDRIAAVVAELVANAYDADATVVKVKLPLNKYLATKLSSGEISEKGYTIEIIDNGHGMTPEEANAFFLKVGRDKRKNNDGTSRELNRPVMGRKGIGKLAPFGVCKKIEVRSAGGKKNNPPYSVSHFMLDYDEIISDTGEQNTEYHPQPLKDHESTDSSRGTVIRLHDFHPKKVPDKETFERQIGFRFGLTSKNFKITVIDNKEEEPLDPFDIGEAGLELQYSTKVDLSERPIEFEGKTYPVTGWVAFSKKPYKNEEFSGVRIYVRGKIAAVTRDFGLPSGFSGEFAARSYMVGAIHADWLDEEEDLIQTSRQDILWNSDLGQAFSDWGKELIKEVARRGREPRMESVKKQFLNTSNLEAKATRRFSSNPKLVKAAVDLGSTFGKFAAEDQLEDEEYIEGLAEIILQVAPHKLLVDTFKRIEELAEKGSVDINELTELFKTTNLAQVASYGQLVYEKVKAIEALESCVKNESTNEHDLQRIIEGAPWLINSEWIPITGNRSLKRFREAFENWYKERTGKEIVTSATNNERKQPDFTFVQYSKKLTVVEIKNSRHEFNNKDWERFINYPDALQGFLDDNPGFKDEVEYVDFIIVADGFKLGKTEEVGLHGLKVEGKVKTMTWAELLDKTKKVHEVYLMERDRLNSVTTSAEE